MTKIFQKNSRLFPKDLLQYKYKVKKRRTTIKKYEIEKEFDDIINNSVENWSLREYLEEVENYGQTEFTYYSETAEMYDKYRQDCQEWLDELVNETGMKPWEYFNSWDYDINSKENKWNVICAMFEQYCIDRLEGLED